VSFIATGDSEEVQDLQRFLTGLSLEQGISVFDDEVVDYDKADLYGIPYLVIINEDSLRNGVVLLRDRETCWFEEIHVAFLTRRLVHVFQKRDVEDTWSAVKREVETLVANDGGKKSEKVKKKDRKKSEVTSA